MKRTVKKKMRQKLGRPPYDLLDEAAHLLRMAPLATHLWYAAGSVPFVLGLLYFWADMTRSAYAAGHAAAGALGVALLWTWMKTAQSVFCGRLLAQAAGAPPPRLGWRGLGRVWAEQTMIQPWGLPALAAASAMTFPLPWVLAFYQNVTVLGTREGAEGEGLTARAWQQARLWPGQLLSALTILSLFGFFILVNLGLLVFLAPQAVKVLFGIESVFTSRSFSMLNTTFLAALGGLTYLCFDPYMKAVFVLRCFYGESLRTGDDLRAELRSAASSAARYAAVAVVAVLMAAGWTAGAQAQEAETKESQPVRAARATASVAPERLDEALREVIQERRYSWRMPREELLEEVWGAEDEEPGLIGKIFIWWRDIVRDVAKATMRGVEKIADWIGNLFRPKRSWSAPNLGLGFMATALKGLMWLVIAALVGVIIWFLVRLAMQYQRYYRVKPEAVEEGPPAAIPDVADESVSADLLPEDEWMALARELWEKGERRLALRALYLGCLAALARQGMVQIAKHKTNRDYERELRRRAHAAPEVMNVFGVTMSRFERVWYGRHEATAEAFEGFQEAYDKMARG